MSPKAAILAIGTEITTGQITNRNAAWISERLSSLGVDVVLHESVADERAMMKDALERCSRAGELIFVTGGLGPTTDDFTREIVAEWSGKKLVFDPPSWKAIEERLTRFGVPVSSSNRQQAFFPEGCEILPNARGTAAGFRLEISGKLAWVLPGPPIEVEGLWEQGKIEQTIRSRHPDLMPAKLFTWQCIGKSEAELGEITEKALSGSGLLTGYRAHLPFVEIKVWVPESEDQNARGWLQKLEQALAPWIVTRQGEDLAKLLLNRLARSVEIEIFDQGTGGILTERLGALLRRPENAAQALTITVATEWISPESPKERIEHVLSQADEEVLTLVIAASPESWALGFREDATMRVETFDLPYRPPGDSGQDRQRLERSRRAITELALKRWREWLDQATV